MGVLQPWLLALGAAMAVPLLLHLFQRHQGPRVLFPALRYLRRAEKESARRIRLRQWLLMLLRLTLVLLITLAAARPFLLGAGAAHEPTAVVLVLDNSMSTGAVHGERRVLDELRERALETVARAGPDDRFWLLRAAAADEPALGGDAVTIEQRIRATEPVPARADLHTALTRARAILRAGAEGRAPEIQLLSDLQATEVRELAAGGRAPPLVVWAGRGESPTNRAITAVEVGGGMVPIAGQRAQLSVSLRGTTEGSDSVPIRVFVADRLVAATAAPLNSTAVVSLPAADAGVLHGRVETDADALRADDVRYFALRVLPPPRVAAPGASEFVTEALRSLEQNGRVRAGGADADVLVLSGAAALPTAGRGRSVVVVPPATAIELAALNGALARAGVSWRYEAPADRGTTQLLVADTADPLHRALQQARLTRNYPLRATRTQPGDSILLRTRAGDAWAVRGELRSGGRFILLGSPLDAEATSIPTSTAMIPLLERIIGTWSAADASIRESGVAEDVGLPADATHVLRPDGVREEGSAGSVRVPALTGVYEVLANDVSIAAFAVNPPAAESDLRRVDGEALARALPGWDLTLAASPAAWQGSIYRARLGLELWRPLLLAALLLIGLESVVAAAGSARKTNSAATEAA